MAQDKQIAEMAAPVSIPVTVCALNMFLNIFIIAKIKQTGTAKLKTAGIIVLKAAEFVKILIYFIWSFVSFSVFLIVLLIEPFTASFNKSGIIAPINNPKDTNWFRRSAFSRLMISANAQIIENKVNTDDPAKSFSD